MPVANSVVRTKGFRRKTPSTESWRHFPGLWPFCVCCWWPCAPWPLYFTALSYS